MEVTSGRNLVLDKTSKLIDVHGHHDGQGGGNDTEEDDGKPSSNKVTPEMRAKVAAFSKAAVEALKKGKDPSLTPEERQQKMHAALAQAANVMLSLAANVDMKKHPDMAQKLHNLQVLTGGLPKHA